jgi:hypothetical protein
MDGKQPAIAVTLFKGKEPISKAKTMSHPIRNRALIVFILGSLATISPFAIDMYLAAFPQIAEPEFRFPWPVISPAWPPGNSFMVHCWIASAANGPSIPV